MALWPNCRRDSLAFLPYRFTGAASGILAYVSSAGSRYNPNVSSEAGLYARTASIPDGYAQGGAATYPIKAGAMSSWQPTSVDLEGQATLISGRTLAGTDTITFSQSAGLSLTVGLTGSGSITITGTSNLPLTIALSGTDSITLTGTGGLSLIVPIEGAGSWALTGSANLKGNLELKGEWTPFTELSPQSLAAAVWSALATLNNDPGTMGELLNGSGAGGNPWIANIDGTYTAGDILRILAAVAAGKSSGHPSSPAFRNLMDTLDRVTGTVDVNGNRTSVTVNP